MKNVLVLMHDDAGQEARFQAALDITRALDGHLTCIDVSVTPALVTNGMDTTGVAILMADEQERETTNRTRMAARLDFEGVPYTWLDESGFLGPCVRENATMADIVVLKFPRPRFPRPCALPVLGTRFYLDLGGQGHRAITRASSSSAMRRST
jgi:hypothetical protein